MGIQSTTYDRRRARQREMSPAAGNRREVANAERSRPMARAQYLWRGTRGAVKLNRDSALLHPFAYSVRVFD